MPHSLYSRALSMPALVEQDGTTALLGLLRNNTLHTGWVGDSRCILSRQVCIILISPAACIDVFPAHAHTETQRSLRADMFVFQKITSPTSQMSETVSRHAVV